MLGSRFSAANSLTRPLGPVGEISGSSAPLNTDLAVWIMRLRCLGRGVFGVLRRALQTQFPVRYSAVVALVPKELHPKTNVETTNPMPVPTQKPSGVTDPPNHRDVWWRLRRLMVLE